MRVLSVHNEHSGPGGAMDVMTFEAEILSRAGHEVEKFVLPSFDGQGLSKGRAAVKAVWNREAGGEVAAVIERFRPDVVHVHTPFPLLSPLVFRVAHARGVPAVGTVHSYRYSCVAGTCFRDGHVCEDCVGSRFKTAGIRHRCYHDSLAGSGALTMSLLLHRTIGTFREAVARFITLTGFSRDLLVRDGVRASQVAVKANAVVDAGVRRPDIDTPYVAFAGRLVDVKGIRTLLDAWRSVAPADLRLRIVGDGELRGLVEERAAADPSIEFSGWVDREAVVDLLGGARCTVLPSTWYEAGPPLVTLQSLSAGTPILTSDLQNLSEDVLADGAGVGFRSGDADSLATVLRTVVEAPHAWERRRAAARASYEARHTPEATLAALESIYTDVRREASGLRT